MCAIVDASVKGEMLSRNLLSQETAGSRFRDWLESGNGRVVVGGSQLRRELFGESRKENRWWRELNRAGVAIFVNDEDVDDRAAELRSMKICESNDEHIIALAQVTQARLLYSNDADLQDDFRNHELVRRPRGKVYSTRETKVFTHVHRSLLESRELCRRIVQ